ncbi:hypothetical protein GCK72_015991 [Caenorhabditis remanei]|uniref:DUF19 domain-containing protein n=1 Tax=Caenorhabditis remanei TaxID=31234 RepID=A0A6A5GY60_CAERE|nr:hypothetical protein GCK72_015991 [Caenorhabditis remanei]KAF1759524.1 hypothetical protein GCK72_015991 [Caenorhabditis remanei]
MLKSLSILLLMLLSIATCRFLTEEDVCKSEEKRWADCFDEWWKNKTTQKDFDFYGNLKNTMGCIESAGRLSEFQQCLTPGARARYPVGVAYNEKVVECIGDLLEHTECSAEDKKKIMSTAYSNRDNLEMVSIVKKDKEYAENFDKDFDATKYL